MAERVVVVDERQLAELLRSASNPPSSSSMSV
jgi:hypothetical protein